MANTHRLPLFPLRTVLFPGVMIPLIVFEPRYRSLVRHCLDTRSPFGVVLIESGDEVETPHSRMPVLKGIGTTARIVRCEELEDGRFLIEAVGESRFHIDGLADGAPYPSADVTVWSSNGAPVEPTDRLVETVCTGFREYLVAAMSQENRQLSSLQLPSDSEALAFSVAAALDIALEDKQRLLEAPSTRDRLLMEADLLDLLLALSGGPVTEQMLFDDETDEPVALSAGAAGESGHDPIAGATIRRLDGAAVRKLMSRN